MSARRLTEARGRLGITVEEASRRTRIPQRYLEALEKGDHAIFPPGPFLKGYTQQYRAFLGIVDEPVESRPEPRAEARSRGEPRPEPRAEGRSRPEPRGDTVPGAAADAEPAGGTRDGLRGREGDGQGGRSGDGSGASGEPARAARRASEGRAEHGARGRDSTPERGADRRPARLRLPEGGGKRAAMGALALVALLLAVKLGATLTPEQEIPLGEAPTQILELRPIERVKVRVTADDRILYEGEIFPKGPDAAPPNARVCDGGCRFTAHDRLEVSVSNLALVNVVYNGELMKPLGAQARPRRIVFIDDTDGS